MMNSMVSAPGNADGVNGVPENMLRSLSLQGGENSSAVVDRSTLSSQQLETTPENTPASQLLLPQNQVQTPGPLAASLTPEPLAESSEGTTGSSKPYREASNPLLQVQTSHLPTPYFGGMAELERSEAVAHGADTLPIATVIDAASRPNEAQIQSEQGGDVSSVEVGVAENNSVLEPQNNFKLDGRKSWKYYFSGSPASRPKATEWMPDSVATQCYDCKVQFDFFTRKHHCRNCGRIFCSKCSSKFMLLPRRFGVREPQRCCNPCATTLEPLQEELVRTMSNQTRELDFNPHRSNTFISNPLSLSMTAEITKAALAVENFFGNCPNATIQDQFIPSRFLKQAKGLAFLTVIKAGFLFSGRVGTGLVVGKGADGTWSAPSAIATMGFGWGAQIGGEVSDFVIILNTEKALEAFSGSGQVSLGAELGMSIGPLGRSGEASLNVGDGGIAPCYTYSQSKGLFAGISLEGAIITSRADVNKRFYGRDYSPLELLSGQVAPPVAARPLYNSLQKALSRPSDPLPAVVDNLINH